MSSRRKSPAKRQVRQPARKFDPQVFPMNAGIGKIVFCYKRKQTVFSQGEAADTVYYIQKGAVQLSVLSKQRIASDQPTA